MGKRILPLLLSLLLLSGCGNAPEAVPSTEATTATSQAPQETVPAPEADPVPDYIRSPLESLSPVLLEETDRSSVVWDSGNRVQLLSTADFSLYLCKASQNGCIIYDIQMENKSDRKLKADIPEFYFNGNIRLKTSLLVTAEAGQWGRTTGRIPFPIAAALGEMEPITQVDLMLTVSETPSLEQLLQHTIHVDITGDAVLTPFCSTPETDVAAKPVLEYFFSGQQLLAEQDGVRLTVLQIGRSQKYDKLICHYRVANITGEWRYLQSCDIAINGIQCTADSGRTDLRPGAILYNTVTIDEFYGMEAIGSIDLRFTTGIGRYQDKGAVTSDWYTVQPDQAAAEPSVLGQGTLLLQEQDLEIRLCGSSYSYSGDPIWQLAITNLSDKDLSLTLWDTAVGTLQGTGSEYMGVITDNNAVYAGKTVIMEVQPFNEVAPVSFRLRVREQQTGTELYVTENRVSLELPDVTP